MPPDYTDQFNTKLDPRMEQLFLNWAMRSGKMRDLADYDLRGAFQAGHTGGNGHLPDTYKKPNHPTFSAESQYSTPERPGGEWVQNGSKWIFKAAPTNVQLHGPDALQDYFKRVEPGNELVLPQ